MRLVNYHDAGAVNTNANDIAAGITKAMTFPEVIRQFESSIVHLRNTIAAVALCSFLLFGCGGSTATPTQPLGTDVSLSSLSVSGGTLDPTFSAAVTNYTATVLFGSNSVDVSATTSDGNASFTINGSNNVTAALAVGDNTVTIIVTAENGTTTRTYTIAVNRTLAQEAYIKASNTDANDFLGEDRVALSGDGNTLAVGAWGEDRAGIGVTGDQTDNSASDAGAAYVFTRDTGGVWTQQAYIKAVQHGCGR